jgi:polysaccharide biosynthesis/export protein
MNFKMPKFLANNNKREKRKEVMGELTKSRAFSIFHFPLFIIMIFFSSCLSYKELINYRTGEEKSPILSRLPKQDIKNQTEITLQANDVLAIIVSSPDPLLALPYNIIPTQAGVQTFTASSPTTYLINSDGFIDLPTIGALKVAGLTVKEVRQEVLTRVSKELVNPSVNVRLINFNITVTGEVMRPGSYQVTNERMTIVEALAAAGDFTPYSDRHHVMIIREKNGVREFGELDFKDTKLFTSPYYFMQQNDQIYVEPTKGKTFQGQQPINTYLQPVQIGISVIAILIALIKK